MFTTENDDMRNFLRGANLIRSSLKQYTNCPNFCGNLVEKKLPKGTCCSQKCSKELNDEKNIPLENCND